MEWPDCSTYLWQLFSIQNAERRGKKGDSKFYHKTSAAYLFICYSALCPAERDQLGPTKVLAPQLMEGLQSKTRHDARNRVQTELGGISLEEMPLPEKEPCESCSGKALMLVWEEVDRLSGLLSPVYLNHSLARMATLILWLCLALQYMDQEALSLEVCANLSHMGQSFLVFFPKAARREVD